MVNNAFTQDIGKFIQNTPIQQELPPGSTGRRYEPEIGIGKHNKRIHKESAYTDSNKKLQFSFRKPPKASGRLTTLKCDSCGSLISGTTATVGVICRSCGKFSSVSEA